MGITRSDLDALLSGITPGLQRVTQELTEIRGRLHQLEMKSMKYCGTWQRAQPQYMRGDAVTHNGGLWYCTRDNVDDAPGVGTGWQLTGKTR